MFFLRRPSQETIDRFVDESRSAQLSYSPVGILHDDHRARRIDERAEPIGRGAADFDRACAALAAWKHFDLGWVELHPRAAPIDAGTNVAVLISHLGFWSLNGCRVVYRLPADGGDRRCGFAYGALTNHAEGGEELFEITMSPQTGEVIYRIRASSWPQAALARLGQPVVRILQARFRRDSCAAMKRAVS